MQRIEVQLSSSDHMLALAHPDNWEGHLLGSPAENLPAYNIIDVGNLPGVGLLDKGRFTLGRRALEKFNANSTDSAAIFSSGRYSIQNRPDALFIGLDRELITTDQGNVIDPSQFDTVEPASAPLPDLGTIAVRFGGDVLHIRSFTVARVMPGVGILALGLRDNPGKKPGPPIFGLDLLPDEIAIGEVSGAQEVLTKVNAIHLLGRKQ